MIRNSIYRGFYGKANSLKAQFFALFHHFSGLPRIVIEAFLRNNFGERHFSFSLALVVAAILLAIPMQSIGMAIGHRGNPGLDFLKEYLTWYVFVCFFIWQSWKHYKVIQLEKKDGFNYEKCSVYEGDIHPFFYGLQYKGRKVTPFEIECVIEPAIFFIAGMVLFLFGQALGGLFLVCSVIYSLSYRALYHAGDMMILDYIDNTLYNKYLEEAFMDNMHPSQKHGVVFRGRHITNDVQRREMAAAVIEDEEIYTAR